MALRVRLPYHRAPFYFAPEFLATADQWQASFKKLVEDVLRREQIDASVANDNRYGLAVVFGRAEFHIDALGGTFWLDDADDRSYGLLHCAPPNEFMRSALDGKHFSPSLRPIVEDVVASFAESLTIEMEARFEEALRIGQAQIEAKEGLRTALFSKIDPQDRRHLRLVYNGIRDQVGSEDADLDDAVFDTGEHLYSFGVVVVDSFQVGSIDNVAMARTERVRKRARKKGPGAPPRYRWDGIDPLIQEIRQRHPTMRKAEVLKKVADRLIQAGQPVPSNTQLFERIRTFFPD